MSIAIHRTFAWFAYAEEQTEHNQPLEFTGYFNQTMRDTIENWQSEIFAADVAGWRVVFSVVCRITAIQRKRAEVGEEAQYYIAKERARESAENN